MHPVEDAAQGERQNVDDEAPAAAPFHCLHKGRHRHLARERAENLNVLIYYTVYIYQLKQLCN